MQATFLLLLSAVIELQAAPATLTDHLSQAGWQLDKFTQIRPGLTHIAASKRGEDPLKLQLIALEPGQFDGQLKLATATGLYPALTPLPDIAKRHQALAGINGGFFVMQRQDGIPGDPVGAVIVDGMLLSEANGALASVIIGPDDAVDFINEPAISADLQLDHQFWLEFTGINRAAGLVRNCGPTSSTVRHDVTCQQNDELILWQHPPDNFAAEIISAEGGPKRMLCYVILNDRLTRLDPANLPKELPGPMILATGSYIEALKTHIGRNVSIHQAPNLPQNLLSSGPSLIKQGQSADFETQQGWPQGHLPDWIEGQHPRSIIAQTNTGMILLMTIDGRQPGFSTGISIPALKELLLKLKVQNALNLDGGGSSTLWLEDKVINSPSSGAPRAIANAILMLPY
ncbi:phosphodiester glycosidase family protein [Shewanella sp. GXUN23E]|uniref:phosphodiester glycosidase family protein n=1 Tax=Shewanella sp. GXUN23E TaxID=3422498 RepID=UPI003D7D7208